ncbi:MAG: hypothetical protein N2112_05595, partial [Gemmataceae bacterium]|nr:hypothetical protein [Gemmataceae bacterium]
GRPRSQLPASSASSLQRAGRPRSQLPASSASSLQRAGRPRSQLAVPARRIPNGEAHSLTVVAQELMLTC